MSQEPDKTQFNMADAMESHRVITWEAVRYQFKLGSTKGTGVTLKNSALKRLLCDTQKMLTRSTAEEHHEDIQSGLLESVDVWSAVLKAASSATIHKFTPAEVKIWNECLDREHGKFALRVGGWVHFWVNHESASPDYDGHPLDFEYDPMHDYSPGLTFEAGMHPEKLALCNGTTIDDISKAYFFHIIATIEKLEACKDKRVEAKLNYAEASSIWMVMRCFLGLRSDLISKWRSQPNHPQITASMRIADAAKGSKSLRLTRSEVRQVLLNCQVVSRPKPKGHPQDPSLHPTKAKSNRKRKGKSSQVNSPESFRARGVQTDLDSADACPTLELSSSPAKDVPPEGTPNLQGQQVLPMHVVETAEAIVAKQHGLMSDVDGNVAVTYNYEEMQTVSALTPEYMTEKAEPTCANEIAEHDATWSEEVFGRKDSNNVYESVLGSEGGDHTESLISEVSYHGTEEITPCSHEDIQEISNRVLSLIAKLQPENEVSPHLNVISLLQHFEVVLGQRAEDISDRVMRLNSSANRSMVLMQETHEEELQAEKARCAMRIEENEKSLDKKLSDIKDKATEDLRFERGVSAKLKQSLNQKISGLENQLQTSKADFEKAQVANTKRQSQLSSALRKAQEDAGNWEKKYDEQVASTSVLQSDYDYTVQELEKLRLENKEASQKRDEKLHALEQELVVLRSNRTNPQVEQDKITEAVRNATHDMRIEVVKAHAELEKKQFEVHGLKTELDQTKGDLKFAWEHVTEDPPSLKEKDDIIASLEEQLAKAKLDTENANALGGSHHYGAMEVSRLEGELAAEQEKSSRLEHALRSASDLLDSIQTMTTQVNGIVTSAGWGW